MVFITYLNLQTAQILFPMSIRKSVFSEFKNLRNIQICEIVTCKYNGVFFDQGLSELKF